MPNYAMYPAVLHHNEYYPFGLKLRKMVCTLNSLIFHLSLLNVSVFWKLHISLRCSKYSIMSILYLKKWSHLETTDWNNIFKYVNVAWAYCPTTTSAARIRIPVHYRNLDKSQMRTLFVFLYIKIWKEMVYILRTTSLMGGKYLETYECLSWFRKRHLYALILEQLKTYCM